MSPYVKVCEPLVTLVADNQIGPLFQDTPCGSPDLVGLSTHGAVVRMDCMYAHTVGDGSPVDLSTHGVVVCMVYIYVHTIGDGSPGVVGLSTQGAVVCMCAQTKFSVSIGLYYQFYR